MTPVLSLPAIPVKYAGRGLIPYLRDRLHALDGHIDIEDAWYPFLQRINDGSIMENFTACTCVTTLELERTNETRTWLHVIRISDLADIRGRRIPWKRPNGEWRADPCPDITWP